MHPAGLALSSNQVETGKYVAPLTESLSWAPEYFLISKKRDYFNSRISFADSQLVLLTNNPQKNNGFSYGKLVLFDNKGLPSHF